MMNQLLNKKAELLIEREKMVKNLEVINNDIEKINDEIFTTDIVGRCFEDKEGRYFFVEKYDSEDNCLITTELKVYENTDKDASPKNCVIICTEIMGYFKNFDKMFKEISKEDFFKKISDADNVLSNLQDRLN